MMRILRTLVGCLVLIAAMIGSAKGAGRPNFLVILCDDLGYGDLACYGNTTIRTPNLDRLASEGIRLTDCYAAAPVCSPSRAGLLTGRNPNRAGVHDWIPPGHLVHLPSGERTVARLLKEAGYATCHVGKWHLNGRFNAEVQPQPDDHGFEYWFSTQNNAAPSHHNPNNFVRNGEPVGELEGYSCQIVADEAIAWLRQKWRTETPFFLFVCFHEPHEPIDSPADLVASYPGATKRGEALYYANVTNMDRAVGRLLEALDEQNLAETTLVFFTSDNGPESLERYPNAWRSHGSPGPLRGMKLHLYEGGIRVPGILRWPGRHTPGMVLDEPICGVDVLPTLCELGDAEVPADRHLDGASFVPIFAGRPIERQTPLFWCYVRALSAPKVSMRVGDDKLLAGWTGLDALPGRNVNAEALRILKNVRLNAFELYDLARDRSESIDRATDEPVTTHKLIEQASRLFGEITAETPVWEFPEPNSRPDR